MMSAGYHLAIATSGLSVLLPEVRVTEPHTRKYNPCVEKHNRMVYISLGRHDEGGRLNIGQRVRRVRREKDITQQSLAARAGLTTNTINRIEKGHVSPSAETLGKIAVGLDCDVGELYPQPAEPLGARAAEGAQLLQALDAASRYAQPLNEQTDEVIEHYRHTIAQLKGGTGAGEARFVEEKQDLSPEAVSILVAFDEMLEKEQARRELAKGGS